MKKLATYARKQVAHAWPIDPEAGTLEVLCLDGGQWTILATHAGLEVMRAEPFAGTELELQSLWADPADGEECPVAYGLRPPGS